MEKMYLVFFVLLPFGFVFAQQDVILSGIVIDIKTQQPLENIVVSIQNSSATQLTKANGKFELHSALKGEQLLLLHSQGYKEVLLKVNLDSNHNLGIIQLEDNFSDDASATLITLSESDLTDDTSTSEMTSGLLQSSKDAFFQVSAFSWGQARFRVRGLDSENGTMMLNGMPMNKVYDGRPQWGNWGGLNDVLRNQEFSVGAASSDHTFGGILGTQQIYTRASIYKKGSRLLFSASNTTYNWRAIGTYASGTNASGWAYVISAGKRIGNEGFFEGTNFKGESFFISIEKKWNDRNALNFTGFYTPNSRGKNSPNTNEVTGLTNEKYNSYWGWQNGKKRNARVKNIEEPLLMLNHYFRINEKANLNSNVMYQFGKIGNSTIDYQNADSPDPVYYRKLPSYFTSLYAKDKGAFSGDFMPDYINAEKSKTLFLDHAQLNWEDLYRTNQKPILNPNNIITGFEPVQSHYVLYEDRTDDKTLAVNSNLNLRLTENSAFDGGIVFRSLKSHHFQSLVDLLGGLYFEDVDAFYTGAQAQSDLQNPNRQVKEGDVYGYNYKLLATIIDAFTQFKFNYNKIDFFLSQSYSVSEYQREGLYQNGIYPTTSLGKSKKVNFENFGFKGGFTYKISGKQWLFFNGMHYTRAPSLQNTFSNSRLNNTIVDDLGNEKVSGAEGSYVFRMPKFKMRATVYYTLIRNSAKTSFFYAEGIFDKGKANNNTDAFVSQTLTQLDKKNIGVELSFEYQISAALKAIACLAYGNYIYSSNPNVSITNDANVAKENTQSTFDFGRSRLKDYKQSGMPQQACAVGLEYRAPKFWWLGVTLNYLAENYIDVAPIARTDRFYINAKNGLFFPEATKERALRLLKQEKFDPISLVNITGGKSWSVFGNNIGLFVSVNNILDVSYKTGGFEQARNANFRALNQDVSSGTPSFGAKYFYGYGRTYFVNLSVNF
jgi:hypothetical protein